MSDAMRVAERRDLFTGRWLRLETISYVDRCGGERQWEAAQRVNSHGAVLIIAELRSSGEIILVRQFRPPTEREVIEFPAGLIDAGESPAETAERELREETGYHGVVKNISPPGFNSPGMTGEKIYMVFMEIDDSDAANRDPSPTPEESEHLVTILVRKAQLAEFIAEAHAGGYGLDAKVIAYAGGLNACRSSI